MHSIPHKRFETLDSLRGICALLVVCFHVRIFLAFTEAPFFRSASCFVEFFFVLSGFVLFHTYGQMSFTGIKFKRYMISRFYRLFPMHVFTIGVVLILEIFKAYAQKKGISFSNPAFTETTSLSELLPNLLLLHAWLPNTNTFSFNIVSWSISIEFYLYIILGLLLFIGNKSRLFIIGFIAIAAFTLIFANVTVVKTEVLRGLSCFFSGCICYIIYQKIAPIATLSKRIYTLIEAFLIVAIFITVAQSMPHKGLIVTIVFCIAVIVFSLEIGYISDLFKLKPFRYLGKLSYSIYIIHYTIWFLFIAIAIIITKITKIQFTRFDNSIYKTRFITTNNVALDCITVLLILGIVIITSNFTYRYIETRGIALGKRILSKDKKE